MARSNETACVELWSISEPKGDGSKKTHAGRIAEMLSEARVPRGKRLSAWDYR